MPFRADTPDRQIIFDWLMRYYEYHLPAAEIVIGEDHGHPFSKTCAVNDAAELASGDVFVIIDADAYIDVRQILEAAHRIRLARDLGRRAWYIPYRTLWRLNHPATVELLESNPEGRFCEPNPWAVENCDGSGSGHHFGALIQIMPREAFLAAGGMDPRFRNWGAEDISFAMCVDTLYARHRTLDGSVVTPDHTVFGPRHHRQWAGGTKQDQNGRLGMRYRRAWLDPDRMRKLRFEDAC